MAAFDQRMNDELDALVYSDPKSALAMLRKLALTYGNDTSFRCNYGGRLLDIGRDLRDTTLIREGISETEKILNLVPPEMRTGLEINIASAHEKLFRFGKSTALQFDQIDSDELSIAKTKFNDLQKRADTFDKPTRKLFFTEFGNCLSNMGRFYEAIRLYEHALEIEPDDPASIANLALSFLEVAFVADDMEALREASEVFGKALAKNTLNEVGGSGVSQRIRERKSEIDNVLQKHSEASHNIVVQANSYQDFCKKAQVFLNFCFHSKDCPHSPADTVMFAVAEVKDEQRLIRWARASNEIKQQFAVARALLFEAFLDPAGLARSDELTTYFDLNDFSVYGLRSGKLKAAYEATFNLFDKIGFFLNDYLQLGIPDKEISFRGLWKDRKNRVRPQLSAYSNAYLRALYEVSKELPSTEHFGVFTDMRNLLTHRYFVLHTKAGDWKSGADGDEYHEGYKKFSWLSLQLLGLAKAAIIYLIAFIRSSEIQKLGGKPHFVRPTKYTRGDSGPKQSEV